MKRIHAVAAGMTIIVGVFTIFNITIDDFKKFFPVEEYYPKYLGCYEDQTVRDFEYLVPGMTSFTQQMCFDKCESLGYMFAGLQYGINCFCGNSYGKYTEQLESECQMPCRGEPNKFCGGDLKNSVYQIKKGTET